MAQIRCTGFCVSGGAAEESLDGSHMGKTMAESQLLWQFGKTVQTQWVKIPKGEHNLLCFVYLLEEE